jgi:hypothetical protein
MVMAAKLTRLTYKKSWLTAPSGRELYKLQFSLKVASPETFWYTSYMQERKKEEQLLSIFMSLP